MMNKKRTFREDFETIPQAPRYEINSAGVVRNRETGYILKWIKDKGKSPRVCLYSGDKQFCFTRPTLLWQMHGKIISKRAPIPVTISKGARAIRFDSRKQCAQFLAEKTSKKFSTIWWALAKKKETVGDYTIHYKITKERIRSGK